MRILHSEKQRHPDPIIIGCQKLAAIPGPKTVREIALASGVSPGTVHAIEIRALKKIRNRIDQETWSQIREHLCRQ